jgi:hypothetical protein
MPSTELTTAPDKPPTRQAKAVAGRSKPLAVTGKLKRAIDFMVWEGSKTDYASAAKHAGMTAFSVRSALEKPHVKAYYMAQVDVLRTSERARNIHRLVEIRDSADNMPAVNAIKEINRVDETQSGVSVQQRAPGVVIQIINQGGSSGISVDLPAVDASNADE